MKSIDVIFTIFFCVLGFLIVTGRAEVQSVAGGSILKVSSGEADTAGRVIASVGLIVVIAVYLRVRLGTWRFLSASSGHRANNGIQHSADIGESDFDLAKEIAGIDVGVSQVSFLRDVCPKLDRKIVGEELVRIVTRVDGDVSKLNALEVLSEYVDYGTVSSEHRDAIIRSLMTSVSKASAGKFLYPHRA